MKIKKISILFIVLCLLSFGAFVVFAYSSTNESQIAKINQQITQLEEQMIVNSTKWSELEQEKLIIEKEMKVFNEKNNNLRKQKETLKAEKRKLGLL